jgi:lysozyme
MASLVEMLQRAAPKDDPAPEAAPARQFDWANIPGLELDEEESPVTPEGKKQLKTDEGLRLGVYKDTKGIDTIGIGFNLEEPANAETFKSVTGFSVTEARAGKKITNEHADALLDLTVKSAEADARKLVPAFDKHDPSVQDAITNFVFNLGLPKAAEFKNTLAAINRGDGRAAAAGIRRSRYYQQVGARGERVASAIEKLGVAGSK